MMQVGIQKATKHTDRPTAHTSEHNVSLQSPASFRVKALLFYQITAAGRVRATSASPTNGKSSDSKPTQTQSVPVPFVRCSRFKVVQVKSKPEKKASSRRVQSFQENAPQQAGRRAGIRMNAGEFIGRRWMTSSRQHFNNMQRKLGGSEKQNLCEMC